MENGYLEQSVSLLTRHERACQREIRESFFRHKSRSRSAYQAEGKSPCNFRASFQRCNTKHPLALYVALLSGHKTEVHLYFEISNFYLQNKRQSDYPHNISRFNYFALQSGKNNT